MIDINNVSFTYGEESNGGGIREVNLHIKRGEFVVLTGASGCGKTTLTRIINGLIPHYHEGTLTGEICLDGENIAKKSISSISTKVASVFQNPRSQFFSVDSTGELAFQLENRGVKPEIIEEKMRKVICEFHIDKLMGRNLFQLSGGEKQKLACAGAALSEAEIIVLDEPSSNLDIPTIEEIKKILLQWKKQGKTIIISEHRLYYLRDLMDRMILLKDGKIEKEYMQDEAVRLTTAELNRLGLRTLAIEDLKLTTSERILSDEVVEFKPFSFCYKNGTKGIAMKNFSVHKGSVVAVVGHNGAGKSTMAKCICGLEKKCKAQMLMEGRTYSNKQMLTQCFLVMQDVNYQLFTESNLDEVAISLYNYKELGEEQREEKAKKILEQMNLGDQTETHPMALSGGQKQRVAISCAIASGKNIIFFDEPTSGLDYVHMNQVAEQICQLSQKAATIFVITHDMELILNCCTHVLHLEKGKNKELYELNENTVGNLKAIFEGMFQ